MASSEIDTKKIVEFDGTKENYGAFAIKFYALCKVKQLARVLSTKFKSLYYLPARTIRRRRPSRRRL